MCITCWYLVPKLLRYDVLRCARAFQQAIYRGAVRRDKAVELLKVNAMAIHAARERVIQKDLAL